MQQKFFCYCTVKYAYTSSVTETSVSGEVTITQWLDTFNKDTDGQNRVCILTDDDCKLD